MDIGAAFPAGGQAAELVEQGQVLFDDPTPCGHPVAGSSAWDAAGDTAPR